MLDVFKKINILFSNFESLFYAWIHYVFVYINLVEWYIDLFRVIFSAIINKKKLMNFRTLFIY